MCDDRGGYSDDYVDGLRERIAELESKLGEKQTALDNVRAVAADYEETIKDLQSRLSTLLKQYEDAMNAAAAEYELRTAAESRLGDYEKQLAQIAVTHPHLVPGFVVETPSPNSASTPKS